MTSLHKNAKLGDPGHVDEHDEIANRLTGLLDYGAVGNGTVDCSLAIQSMVPCVIVPTGTYMINQSIVAGNFLVFAGMGREQSILRAGPSINSSLLKLSIGGFHIRNIMMFVYGYPAIECVTQLIDGIFESCWFNGGEATGSAPLISGDLNNVSISRCTFEQASHGIRLSGTHSQNVSISDCVFWDIRDTMLEFDNSSYINLSNLFLEEKNIENSLSSAIVFNNCSHINLDNIMFLKAGGAPPQAFAHAIHFENCHDININNVISIGFPSGTPYEFINCTGIYTPSMVALA